MEKYFHFDSESKRIADIISENSTIEEIAEVISIVLSKAFDESFDINKCITPAEKIYKAIG
ncbi:MAG: hypothetical protein GX236_00615 [Clostridiaceae bacterium]|nr:hypothetical protein [Clostridiaceae bacterium]